MLTTPKYCKAVCNIAQHSILLFNLHINVQHCTLLHALYTHENHCTTLYTKIAPTAQHLPLGNNAPHCTILNNINNYTTMQHTALHKPICNKASHCTVLNHRNAHRHYLLLKGSVNETCQNTIAYIRV